MIQEPRAKSQEPRAKSQEPRAKSISIIGFGASGLITYINLIKEFTQSNNCPPITIYIFEKNKKSFSRGLAYSTTEECLILNMKISSMSIDNDNQEDFQNYLDNIGYNSKNSFVPRKIYGDYLYKRYIDSYNLSLLHNIKTVLVFEEVKKIKKYKNNLSLLTKTKRIKTNFVVMCLGNLESSHYIHLKKSSNYIHTPYSLDRVREIKPTAKVSLIGSSLTAVDIAILLRNFLHQGKIYICSRNGFLPDQQISTNSGINLKYLNKKTLRIISRDFSRKIPLQQIIELFQKEIKDHNNLQLNIEDINLCLDLSSINYKEIINSTASIISNIWNQLLTKDKIYFIRKYYSLWSSHRHCMPLQNYQIIKNMLETNQVELVKGLNQISIDDKSFKLFIKNNLESKSLKVDYVINCTGAGISIKNTSSELLNSLYYKNLIKSHPCGGLYTEFNTNRIIDKRNKISKNVYCIGMLTQGTHFYTNSIETVSLHAKNVAKDIFNNF